MTGAVIYAGRDTTSFSHPALSSWNVLPKALADAVENAEEILILDPMSFPFESLSDDAWDVPMTIAIPNSMSISEFHALFGQVVMRHMTVVDQFIAHDPMWGELRGLYKLNSSQHLPADKAPLTQIVDKVIEDRKVWSRIERAVTGARDQRTYWTMRSRTAKQQLRTITRHLETAISKARASLPESADFRVVIIGDGPSRWTPVARSFDADVVTYDRNPAAVAHANLDNTHLAMRFTPDARIARAEDVAVVLIMFELAAADPDDRLATLEAAWAALAIGGTLIVLDDFVSEFGYGVSEFERDILDATSGTATLLDAMAFSPDNQARHRSGLISFLKLGSPVRW